MKDTHEANLPTEENGKLEETKAPETTPENTAEEVVTNETTDAEVAAEETSEAEVKTDEVAAGEETVATTGKLSKEEILEKLTGLVGAAADATRNEVEALKQAYYKIHRSEVDELKKPKARSKNCSTSTKKNGLPSLPRKNGLKRPIMP